jgi:hypothetical protein
MLTQALQSDDRALLDEVLAVSDATIINNTLRRLPAHSVLPLLAACVRLFHGKPRRAMALALWLRSLLACHAAYLASLPDLTAVSCFVCCVLICGLDASNNAGRRVNSSVPARPVPVKREENKFCMWDLQFLGSVLFIMALDVDLIQFFLADAGLVVSGDRHAIALV